MNKSILREWRHLFTIAGILLIFTLPITAYTASAWDDCPFGLENDPYPGECPRYVDTNGDGICDHSQPQPSDVESDASSETESGKFALIKYENEKLTKLMLTLLIVIGGIALTKFAVRKHMISRAKSKIIWNIFLLIFFLFSAITGIMLILFTTFPSLRDIGIDFIQLHIVTSFLFMWISGYHVLAHTKYYIRGMKSLFSNEKLNHESI